MELHEQHVGEQAPAVAKPPMNTHVVVGPYCWGKGITFQQALNRALYGYGKNYGPMPYNAYLSSENVEVDGHGRISAQALQRVREVRYEDGKKVVRVGANIKND